MGNHFALAEIEVASRQVKTLVKDTDWDLRAPRYSPDGQSVAFIASHQGRKHTMPDQLAICHRQRGDWQVVSADWDHAVHAPLLWEEDGLSVLFAAEQQGRTHLWRFELASRSAEVLVQGGWLGGFDKRSAVRAFLQQQWKVRLRADDPRFAYVGDSFNDAPMFEAFALSVGVANVLDVIDRLDAPPKYVTRAREGRGFCELVDAIARARRS